MTRAQFTVSNIALLVALIGFMGLAEAAFLSTMTGVQVLLLVALAAPCGIAFGWIKARIYRRVSVGMEPYLTALYRKRFIVDRVMCSASIGLLLAFISFTSMESATAFNADTLLGVGPFGFLFMLSVVLADYYFTQKLVTSEPALTDNEDWIIRLAMKRFRPGSRGDLLR